MAHEADTVRMNQTRKLAIDALADAQRYQYTQGPEFGRAMQVADAAIALYRADAVRAGA